MAVNAFSAVIEIEEWHI